MKGLLIAYCLLGVPAAKDEAPSTSGDVTYNQDIAPILMKQCADCHRPGEVAPFSLLTFEDAEKHAKQIVEVVKDKLMPPWKAERHFGEFMNERHLDDAEIDKIAAWVEAGSPRGDGKAPKPPRFTTGWQLGKPDMVLELPSFPVPAEGRDIYRCFVVPLKIPGGVWVDGIEFRAGNRKIVHHALYFLDASGKARENDRSDPEPGYASLGGLGFIPMLSLGGWAPGTMPYRLPKGIAKPLPGGVDLVVQMHYHPSGKPEADQSKIGIYFAKKPPKKRDIDLILGSVNIDIPAGEKEYRIQDSLTVPVDCEVLGIVPHAHYIGKEMKVVARPPRSGKEVPLLWIRDWAFDWQEHYRYAKPVRLKAGTRIEMEFIYDNSEGNPNNPSRPPQRVQFGESTTDEMALMWVNVVPQDSQDYPRLVAALQDSLVNKIAGLASGDVNSLVEQFFGK